MSKIRLNIFLGLIFISYYNDLYSQIQDKDDIQTQEVTVVKSNQPIISNVFKIRSAPMIGDSLFQRVSINTQYFVAIDYEAYGVTPR